MFLYLLREEQELFLGLRGPGEYFMVNNVPEGWQNIPSPKRPLWHKDDFELKALNKQQVWEGHSDLPFLFLKARNKTLTGKMSSL